MNILKAANQASSSNHSLSSILETTTHYHWQLKFSEGAKGVLLKLNGTEPFRHAAPAVTIAAN